MKQQQQVEVTITHGIVQDYRGTGLRQVTLLDVGQWQTVLDELGVDLPWYTRRANLLIAGIDLPATVGWRLQIGACRFAIGGETTPASAWTNCTQACAVSWSLGCVVVSGAKSSRGAHCVWETVCRYCRGNRQS